MRSIVIVVEYAEAAASDDDDPASARFVERTGPTFVTPCAKPPRQDDVTDAVVVDEFASTIPVVALACNFARLLRGVTDRGRFAILSR